MKTDLYIQMFSIHGLIRYNNIELGRDADTGGQIKYVIELAEQLSQMEAVKQVDLFTRLISDKRVSDDYRVPIEEVNDKFRIVRVQCGGKRYMRKELLWPHLDEFIDKTIRFIKREGMKPDIIHGHYVDAGYVGIQLSEYFKAPFIFTGHSLGRPKKERLLKEGMSEEEINKVYKIEHRIEVEEEILKNADLIVTSTTQEIEKQYGMYNNQGLAKYRVIPPGLNLEKFYPYYHDTVGEKKKEEEWMQAKASIVDELNRFFMNPERPLVLALCRADKRKNISGLIEAYGQDKELQAMANLAIFAGIRKNISEMEENEKDVLTQMLLLMDKHDLYGKMAIPKRHDFTYEVPELYRITGERKGVFANVALTEPFGLTLIEASACGVPIVSTNDGGPRDIIANCQNGTLVDPLDSAEISAAIKAIISDGEQWKEYSTNGIKGVREHYSWDAHASKYFTELNELEIISDDEEDKGSLMISVGDRITNLNYFLITDIDNTMLGDDEALEKLMEILRNNRDNIGFGVATGRVVDSALEVFEEYDLVEPDLVISSVGSEMYYRGKSFPDKGWQAHIAKNWDRDKIRNLLDEVDFLNYQEEETQRRFKVSYYMEPDKDRLAYIHDILTRNRCHYNLIYSHNQFLDILPHRASKGKAIRYFSYKWEIPLENIMVCGDSGNDAEMLIGSVPAVVVGNYSEELEKLRGRKRIFFSDKNYARGIIDGFERYDILNRANS